jgi:hypothetical protein
MAKARAKLIISVQGSGFWHIHLRSDLGDVLLEPCLWDHRASVVRARAWSRRLGGIPVEVEE